MTAAVMTYYMSLGWNLPTTSQRRENGFLLLDTIQNEAIQQPTCDIHSAIVFLAVNCLYYRLSTDGTKTPVQWDNFH